MNAILQTDSWVETETCSGPRNIRIQRSRESPGVIMTDIQDKYIPEFTLPYRNVDRYIKEVKNSWNRLDKNQRKSIKKSFKEMDMCETNKTEIYSDEIDDEIDDGTLECSVKYILKDSNNIIYLLDLIWNPTGEQIIKYSDKKEMINDIKRKINEWGINNMTALHCNWKSGLCGFFIILFFIMIGIIIGSLVR